MPRQAYATATVRLDPDRDEILDVLCAKLNKSRNYVLIEALDLLWLSQQVKAEGKEGEK